jgi:hypothetical protein
MVVWLEDNDSALSVFAYTDNSKKGVSVDFDEISIAFSSAVQLG